MLIDANSLPDGTDIQADLCIVGGGAAGITLALQLADTGIGVVLLESGGLEYEPEYQALCRGQSVGQSYYALDVSRLRFLGGATNHWEGLCRPLDPEDFQPNPRLGRGGWPIAYEAVARHYPRAHEIVGLGPYKYDVAHWETGEYRRLPFDPERFETRVFQSNEMRFGKTYRPILENANNIRVYYHATVLDFRTDTTGAHIRSVTVGTLPGARHRVRAHQFVLATGGIENARLLLLSNHDHPHGLGNEHDLVGRHFMEHLTYRAPAIGFTVASAPLALYRWRNTIRGTDVTGFTFPSFHFQARHDLVSSGCVLQPLRHDGLKEAARRLLTQPGTDDLNDRLAEAVWAASTGFGGVQPDLRDRLVGPECTRLQMWAEQLPNPASRVTLGSETDAFGQPRVRLDWQPQQRELRSIERFCRLFAAELGRTRLGRLKVTHGEPLEQWPESLTGGNHHMGTTRMGATSRQGVVDGDCRVHGLSNLYVAGSSVFPTGGHANPTLTIVALAVRLAAHLRSHLDAPA